MGQQEGFALFPVTIGGPVVDETFYSVFAAGHCSADGFQPVWVIVALTRIHVDVGRLKRILVIPRHPIGRFALQLRRVPLQLGQIIERIRATQLAAMDQTHEQIAHASAIPILIK
jgi:hypothetical protein